MIEIADSKGFGTVNQDDFTRLMQKIGLVKT